MKMKFIFFTSRCICNVQRSVCISLPLSVVVWVDAQHRLHTLHWLSARLHASVLNSNVTVQHIAYCILLSTLVCVSPGPFSTHGTFYPGGTSKFLLYFPMCTLSYCVNRACGYLQVYYCPVLKHKVNMNINADWTMVSCLPVVCS